jgi:hypothetical protein
MIITKLYRKWVPQKVRDQLNDLGLGQLLRNLRNIPAWGKGVWIWVFSPLFPKNEYYDAYRFVGRHGVTFYPFKSNINIKLVNICLWGGDWHVIHNGKKLFFAKRDANYTKVLYRSLLIEQDTNSPHRYVNSYDELDGKILLDVGAAEGIFALDVIERVKKVYIFECGNEWIEPLKKTFQPWKEKVEFVHKYVSNIDNDSCITLDTFFKDKENDNLFIKMDIEGEELNALYGAQKLLKNGENISLAICTYHKDNDAEMISNLLTSLDYQCEFTPGFLLINSKLRKGVCRGKK